MPCKTPAEWLSKLPLWDGTPRLARWLTTYLGAVDTPYTRLVSRLFIIGMIARALNPGVKFDYCIVLEGSQGIGKSEALRILGGKWFSDSAFDLSNRDAMAALRGKWLYEFSELGRITRADARTKSFIERTFDEFRPLYEKRPVRLYRQCVFVGTTNEYKWRMDDPDVRTFLPVHCSRIDLAGLKADRKQLFSEALAAYTLLPDVLFDLTVEYTAATAPRIDIACSGVARCPNCRQAINQQGSSESATATRADSISGSFPDSATRAIQPDSSDEALSRENTSSSSDSISVTSGEKSNSTPEAS